MDRRTAALGSALFLLAAPGTVAGLIPWWLTGWHRPPGSAAALAIRAGVGGLLVAAGLVVLLGAFARFVREGLGTPAPIAPTDRLVVGGAYRFVRNPMYVAVVAIVLGQAVGFASVALLGYAVVLWAVMAAFVLGYEEPVLADRYGAAYAEYRRHVRAWIPRLRPWSAP